MQEKLEKLTTPTSIDSKNFFIQRSIGGNSNQPTKSTAPSLASKASKEASGDDDETAPELIPSEKDKKTN